MDNNTIKKEKTDVIRIKMKTKQLLQQSKSHPRATMDEVINDYINLAKTQKEQLIKI